MVDNSQRDLHGALLDAEILADVYLVMTGGQVNLNINDQSSSDEGWHQVLVVLGGFLRNALLLKS